MSLTMEQIGNDQAFMERWALEQDRLAAGLIALDLSKISTSTVPSKFDKPLLTREDLDRAIKALERVMPRPSEYVVVEMNPQMAKLVGCEAVAIHRRLYENLVALPSMRIGKTDWAARLKPGEELY